MTQVFFRRSNPKEVLVDRCGAVVNDLAEARDCRPTSCNPSPTDAVWRFGTTADQRYCARRFRQHVGMSPRYRRRVIPEGCRYELAIPRLLLPGRGLHRTRNRASVPPRRSCVAC
jgi:hypothetical protein